MASKPIRIAAGLLGGVIGYYSLSRLELFGAPALKSVPAPAARSGETRAAPPGLDFSLTLPKGWVAVDPKNPAFLSAMRENFGEMKGLSDAARRFDVSSFALYAIDAASVRRPIPRTVNVVRRATSARAGDPAAMADTLATELVKQVSGAKVLKKGTIDLPIGTVPRLVSSVQFPTASGGQAATTTVSYVFVDKDQVLNLTVTGGDDERATIEKAADAFANGFRVGG